ncbi:MAG: hypothetical protein AB1656_01070 [Candidatus Omnitrophota bacterium]
MNLNDSGDLLFYAITNGEAITFHIVDLNNEVLYTQYKMVKFDLSDGMTNCAISSSLETLAFTYLYGSGIDRLYVLTRKDKEFSSLAALGEADLVSDLFVSSAGNAIYYNAKIFEEFELNGKPSGDYFYYSFAIYRDGDGWTKPVKLTVPNVEKPIIADVAQDGNLLLIKTGKKGIALTRKDQNGWSEPEYLDQAYDGRDRFKISENGKVLVYLIARKPYPDSRSAEITKYDIDLLIDKSKGIYEKKRLTKDNVSTYDGGYLLSPDGSRLFWRPMVWPSAIQGFLNR